MAVRDLAENIGDHADAVTHGEHRRAQDARRCARVVAAYVRLVMP